MGLDWNKIREEREARQGPERAALEREQSPFDERGNLKGSRATAHQAEEKRKDAARQRQSRAKPNAMSRQQAGAKASKPTRVPDPIRNQMAMLYGENWSFRRIGEKLGYHDTTVRHILITDGVHTPEKRKKGELADG